MKHCPTCTCDADQIAVLLLRHNAEGYEGTICKMPPGGRAIVGDMEVIARGQYDSNGRLIRELPAEKPPENQPPPWQSML